MPPLRASGNWRYAWQQHYSSPEQCQSSNLPVAPLSLVRQRSRRRCADYGGQRFRNQHHRWYGGRGQTHTQRQFRSSSSSWPHGQRRILQFAVSARESLPAEGAVDETFNTRGIACDDLMVDLRKVSKLLNVAALVLFKDYAWYSAVIIVKSGRISCLHCCRDLRMLSLLSSNVKISWTASVSLSLVKWT